MEIIVSESNRLSKILEEFLRFVRPQERRVAEFDVARTIIEVMDLFRLSDEVSDAHRIEVGRRAGALDDRRGPRSAPADPLQHRQECRPRDVRGRNADRVVGREEDAWYRIRFTDTGRGMSEEELSRLFTPFSTAFDGGTGLGMAIVRRIVEDHGGAIDAESRPGEGTTVTVLLPRSAGAGLTERGASTSRRGWYEQSAASDRGRRGAPAGDARHLLPQGGLRGAPRAPTSPRACADALRVVAGRDPLRHPDAGRQRARSAAAGQGRERAHSRHHDHGAHVHRGRRRGDEGRRRRLHQQALRQRRARPQGPPGDRREDPRAGERLPQAGARRRATPSPTSSGRAPGCRRSSARSSASGRSPRRF